MVFYILKSFNNNTTLISRALAYVLVVALILSYIDTSTILSYANNNTTITPLPSSYGKSDFIIQGTVLKGFTTAGVAKHNALQDGSRSLVIPEDWGITSIDKFAFLVHDEITEDAEIGLKPYEVADNHILIHNITNIQSLSSSSDMMSNKFYMKSPNGYNYNSAVDNTNSNVNNIFFIGVTSGYSTNKTISFKNYTVLNSNQISKPFDYISIPSTVTTIDDGAFMVQHNSDSNTTTGVVINNTTNHVSIKNTAFLCENGNVNIDIKNTTNISEIGLFAFYNKSETTTLLNADFSANTTITAISDNAFLNATLLNLKLPQNITKIGVNSFCNTKVGSTAISNRIVTLPSSLTHIYENAFNYSEYTYDGISNLNLSTITYGSFANTNVINATFPSTITEIRYYAFAHSFVDDISFVNTTSLQTIQQNAFKDTKTNKNRVDVILPDSLKTLEPNAFLSSSFIRNLTFGSGLKIIESNAFSGQYNNIPAIDGTVTLHDNIHTIKQEAFQYNNITNSLFNENSTTLRRIENRAFNKAISLPSSTLVIPPSVEFIGDAAFGNNNIKEVEFKDEIASPSRLATIGINAFVSSIKNQDTLIFPKNLVEIYGVDSTNSYNNAHGAFGRCNIGTIIFNGNKIKKIGGYAFSESTISNIQFKHDSLKEIHNGAFYNCAQLTNVDLGNATNVNLNTSTFSSTPLLRNFDFTKIANIGANAFTRSGLTDIHIGTNIKSIGNGAFSETTLNSVEYNPSINYIPESMFYKSKISNIRLHNNINTIKTRAFDGATLDNIDFINNNTILLDNVFMNTTINQVNLDNAKNIVYGNGTFHSSTINDVTSTLNTISNSIFYNATINNSLILKNTEVIEKYAFSHATLNTNIVFPGTLRAIKTQAFYFAAPNLDLNFNTDLDTIEDYAFAGTNINTITFKKRPKNIGDAVFAMYDVNQNSVQDHLNSDINKVILSPDFKDIPSRMFQGRDNIFSINLDNITTIHKNAFQLNIFPTANNAFFKTKLPNLIEIHDNAFNGAQFPNATILQLPDSLERIGSNAFSKYLGRTTYSATTINAVEFGSNIKQVGSNAFGGINILDYSTVPDYIKQNTNKFSKMFSIADNNNEYPQKYNLNIRGKYFPIDLKDYDGNTPHNYLNDKIERHTDGNYFVKAGQSLPSRDVSHSVLGTWITTITNRPYTPSWKSNLKVVRTINDNPAFWVNNAPNDGIFTVLSGLDLATTGQQNPTVRLDFNDKSYSIYTVAVNVVRALADDWTPTVNVLEVTRGNDIDISTAVTNVPSNVTIVSKDVINTREVGLKHGKIKYEFTDKTQKIVNVDVNVVAKSADKWIPNTKTALIARTNDATEFDLWSLVLNVPDSGVTKTVITPIYYNMDHGVHTGVVRVTFNDDNSYKDVQLQVTISDQATTFIARLKKLTTLFNQNIELSDAIINKPPGIGFETIQHIDVTKLGTQFGKLKAIFADLSTKIFNVEVEVLDPNTEAVNFVPSLKVLKTYVHTPIDIRTGLKNMPTTASASVIVDVNVNEVGRKVGTIRVLFSDNSTKDINIDVDVFNRDFFEVDDESEIPAGYTKITFSADNGASFVDDTISSRIYAAKQNIPIAFKFFPNVVTTDTNTYLEDKFIWSPLVSTIIETTPIHFKVSGQLDTRTAAEKFIPQTKILLLYKNDYTTSLTECLVNKPTNMANLNVKVEAQRNSIGTHDGLLELVFDDASKLDIPVKVQVVGNVNTKADAFVPITQELAVNVGDNIDIKTGLLNSATEYDTLAIKKDINTTQAGRVTGTITVQFDDGSSCDVNIYVFVRNIATNPIPTEADAFIPTIEQLEVEVGGNIDIKSALKNDRSTYKDVVITNDINTTIVGRVTGTLEISFNDNSTKEVIVPVYVRDKTILPPTQTLADVFVPNTKMLEVNIGDNVTITDGLLNDTAEYDSIDIIKDVDTTRAGKVIGTIRVNFTDNSSVTINITVLVKSNIATPIDTLASKYIPTTVDLNVDAGKSINIKTGLTSDTTDIINISIIDDVDTTFAGQKIGKLLLRFTDNSTLEVLIRVIVTGNTSLNINNGSNNSGGSDNNTNTDANNKFLTEAIKQLQEALNNSNSKLREVLSNSTNNSTTILQTTSEQDKLGSPIVKGKIEVRNYINLPKDGMFMPDAKITRADLVVMFASLKELRGTKPVKFSDVKNGMPYFKALQACVSNNIINGYNDNTFRPNNPITRAEFAKIISSLGKQYNTTTFNKNNFIDVVSNHWAYNHINNAFLNGYINGYPDGSFKPNNYITRAEAVKVLNRYGNKLILRKDILESADIVKYEDVSEEHWAFADITSALNSLTIEKFVYSKDPKNKLHYRIVKNSNSTKVTKK